MARRAAVAKPRRVTPERAYPLIRRIRDTQRAMKKPADQIDLWKWAGDTNELLVDLERFLTRRLTPAAIYGCHHGGERAPDEKQAPCHWCGLKH